MLRDIYGGALPLPMSAVRGYLGAPQEVMMDIDLLSYCPEKLLVYAAEVGRLKAAWDEEIRRLLLRFGLSDEASLLSGHVNLETAGPLRHIESWNTKVRTRNLSV